MWSLGFLSLGFPSSFVIGHLSFDPRIMKQTKAPKWFIRAIQAQFDDRFVSVEGCRIHYLRWGRPGKPGLLFVHGGFAHAHWWDGIAPAFVSDYTVAAIDLSGM